MLVRDKGLYLDFGQAYNKAADYCAVQERCISDMKLKLKSWSVDKNHFSKIIRTLQEEGFLDESRFALSYVGGKFRINGWGRLKIIAGLRFKSVPSTLIENAILTINDEEYFDALETLLDKKLRILGGNTLENRQKAAYYAASRGFEPGLISRVLREEFNG
ncbi:MAG: regulatory protein RecX [Bacteroidales bacterium]